MASGLISTDEIIGKTFEVVDGDDGQLKLRQVETARPIRAGAGTGLYIAAGDYELLISESE